jgi:hypothetical protein
MLGTIEEVEEKAGKLNRRQGDAGEEVSEDKVHHQIINRQDME